MSPMTPIAAAALAPASAAPTTARSAADFIDAYNRHLQAAEAPPAPNTTLALLEPFAGLNAGSSALAQHAGAINGAHMRPSDVMELTMRTHEFVFRCEMTATVANRSSDGAQTLFRQQS
jgi:hypothetical protein